MTVRLTQEFRFINLSAVGERLTAIGRREHVAVSPRYLLPGEAFDECRWCQGDMPGPAVVEFFWLQGARMEVEHSCLACVHDVIELADQSVEREGIQMEYPIFAPDAMAGAA